MTDGFTKHGIDHLSASSINLWTNAPDVWVAKYLHKHSQPFGAAAKRGQAVETAVYLTLMGEDMDTAIAKGIEQFDHQFMFADEKTSKERDVIDPMTRVAVEALKEYGQPQAGGDFQHKVSITADFGDWSIPVIGFLDFTYPDLGLIIDLKTTNRMPSTMSADHQRQAAIYTAAMGNQSVKFLYCSPKKTNLLACDDVAGVLADTKRTIRRMERFLSLHSAADALEVIPTNRHSFYWQNDQDGWEKLYG
jgi:hypothetical protein